MVYWVSLIEPNKLFNMINREFKYACITDVMFLLLLDARTKEHYNESHIITAKLAQRNKDGKYTVSPDYELECRTNIVVYDHETTKSDLINQIDTPALECAKTMWESSKQTSIQVLTGGYKDFSAFYPFLRTRKLFYMPKELDDFATYPVEIIPGHVYMGRRQHAERAYMQKDLKISRHINCSSSPSKLFPHISRDVLTLDLSDIDDVTLYAKFQTICDFIELDYGRPKGVLIYSDHGVIRSAVVVMAYIIYCYLSSYDDAYKFIKDCCPKVCLENKFKPQLLKWVEDVKTNPFAIRRYQRSTEPNLLKLPIIDQSKLPQPSFMYTHEHHPVTSLDNYKHSRARKSTDVTYNKVKASERLVWDIKYSVDNLRFMENAYSPSVASSACNLVKVGRIDREKNDMEVDPGIKVKFLERTKKIKRQKQKLKEKKRKLKAERKQLEKEAEKIKETEKELPSVSGSRVGIASGTEPQSPIEAVYSPLPPIKDDELDLLTEYEEEMMATEKEEDEEEEEEDEEDEDEEEDVDRKIKTSEEKIMKNHFLFFYNDDEPALDEHKIIEEFSDESDDDDVNVDLLDLSSDEEDGDEEDIESESPDKKPVSISSEIDQLKDSYDQLRREESDDYYRNDDENNDADDSKYNEEEFEEEEEEEHDDDDDDEDNDEEEGEMKEPGDRDDLVSADIKKDDTIIENLIASAVDSFRNGTEVTAAGKGASKNASKNVSKDGNDGEEEGEEDEEDEEEEKSDDAFVKKGNTDRKQTQDDFDFQKLNDVVEGQALALEESALEGIILGLDVDQNKSEN